MNSTSLEINKETTEQTVLEKIFAHRIFNGLTRDEITSVLGYFKIRFPKAKTILEREGVSVSKELFIIIEGNLSKILENPSSSPITFQLVSLV